MRKHAACRCDGYRTLDVREVCEDVRDGVQEKDVAYRDCPSLKQPTNNMSEWQQ